MEDMESISSMSSVSDKDIVDEIKSSNGDGVYQGEDVEYIIEYHNIIDRAPSWKLCRNRQEYEHQMIHMGNGAFVNPRLIWVKNNDSNYR